ncbi:MAG: hypothetical protein RSC56_02640 [Acidaminococcaceae bacterium]
MTEEKVATAQGSAPQEMGAEEFLELAAVIREKIRTSEELTAEGKKATLAVLDGVTQSVKAHGVRQHGLTKKIKRVALTVFERLSKDTTNTERETAVYQALLVMTWEGLRSS